MCVAQHGFVGAMEMTKHPPSRPVTQTTPQLRQLRLAAIIGGAGIEAGFHDVLGNPMLKVRHSAHPHPNPRWTRMRRDQFGLLAIE